MGANHFYRINANANAGLFRPRGMLTDHPAYNVFCGRHVGLIGDFRQQQPVGDHALYTHAADLQHNGPAHLTRLQAAATNPLTRHRLEGINVYREAFANVIMLHRQQRQSSDATGARLTEMVNLFAGTHLPTREQLSALVDDLNGRVTSLASLLEDVGDVTSVEQVPRVVVQRNEFRHELNTTIIQALAVKGNKRLVFWRAKHTPADTSSGPLPQPVLQAAQAQYDGMGGLTPDTWYFDGALFLLTENVNPEVGRWVHCCRWVNSMPWQA